MITEIRLPEISENVDAADVIDVLVSPGDAIRKNDPVIEIETEKATVEVPSPYEGTVIEIMVKKGDTIKVGSVILTIEIGQQEGKQPRGEKNRNEAGAAQTKRKKADGAAGAGDDEPPSGIKEEKEKPAETPRPEPAEEPAPAAPSVRRLARELGVDIHKVTPGGPGGRITDSDVKRYVKKRFSRGDIAGDMPERLPDFSKWGEIERKPLSKIRTVIAENMKKTWRIIPHVNHFDKADITRLEAFRKKYNSAHDKSEKLTITGIMIKILASAVKVFPHCNASIDTEKNEIIIKHYVHIGIAVDTERGLLVPVLRNADTKSIARISREIIDLAARTREKKIRPEELEGGTITISNLGGIGGTNFTPLIYHPQAAIIGVSTASYEPFYENGTFQPRLMLPLSLSYDHRIIDGADAARFLRWIVDAIENPLLISLEGAVS